MRRHAFFIGLFVIIAVARFMILLTSQTHVHSDEAIIGLMGKHILEGRYFPFYMYGQPYNAGAAWEAYLAAIAFAVFGVSVIPLKSCILVLSLLCLVLFYWMCLALYDQRTALLAAIVFAVTPSLLKWHFQVRGYSWYFLSIPILTMLFTSVASDWARKQTTLFFFGLASAVSIWCLELAIPIVAAFWMLLILRRKLSLNNADLAFGGCVVGYLPVVACNLMPHFNNWRQERDFDMLLLTAASFVPYLTVRPGVPSYFFGGCFFPSVLTGRMLERSFSYSKALPRLGGAVVLSAILLTGTVVIVGVGQENQIETLSSCDEGKSYCMTRIPAVDIEGVEDYLCQHHVTSVWTTISFIYPLLFESGETLAVSNAIFEDPYRVYPREIPWREPSADRDAAFIIETVAPFRSGLEMRYGQAFGTAPFIREYGKLTVITEHE